MKMRKSIKDTKNIRIEIKIGDGKMKNIKVILRFSDNLKRTIRGNNLKNIKEDIAKINMPLTIEKVSIPAGCELTADQELKEKWWAKLIPTC